MTERDNSSNNTGSENAELVKNKPARKDFVVLLENGKEFNTLRVFHSRHEDELTICIIVKEISYMSIGNSGTKIPKVDTNQNRQISLPNARDFLSNTFFDPQTGVESTNGVKAGGDHNSIHFKLKDKGNLEVTLMHSSDILSTEPHWTVNLNQKQTQELMDHFRDIA